MDQDEDSPEDAPNSDDQEDDDEGEDDDEEEEDVYSECALSSEKRCRSFKDGRTLREDLEDVSSMNGSVSAHLQQRFKFDHDLVFQWTEKLLIENRLGRMLESTDKLCPYHRYSLGTKWQPPKQCSHPAHGTVRRGQKSSKAGRRLPLETIMKLNTLSQYSYKIGAQVCPTHREWINDELKNFEAIEPQHDQTDLETTIDDPLETTVSDPTDEPYEPPVYIVDEPEETVEENTRLSDILHVSPLKWRVSKPLDDVHDSGIRYFKRKREEFIAAAEKHFDSYFAPGQPQDKIAKVLYNKDDPSIPDDLEPLVENYMNSDSFGKLVVLSLVNHEIHTKAEIMEIFGCSKNKVDQARSLRAKQLGVFRPEERRFTRNRLNTNMCEHFIEFIFSSGLLQDVAYGTTTITFDSGDTQSVPQAVLQCKYSHLIEYYKKFCAENNVNHLSESSLWKILKAIKPSRRKSLAGLDDITAEGMNGFEFLSEVIKKYHLEKDWAHKLERAKRYLKISYQGHCDANSGIKSHNTSFALSLPGEEPALVVSDDVCAECCNVVEVMLKFLDLAQQTPDEDLKYDVQRSVANIMEYMKHQIRDSQQKLAKELGCRSVNYAISSWLRDYSQKILPMSYREGQRKYFGKKGMSLQVDVFISRPYNDLEKMVYLTLIHRSEQTKLDTMNIADHVLAKFVQDYPNVEMLYGKSDNAGAYHGNQILENLFKLCKKHHVSLVRYDYNEPCRGKDQCDRESAACKKVINSFVNAGNDLLTATDVFDALHYGSGIQNAQASVIEIDVSSSTLLGPKIPSINSFHSAKFSVDSMKLFRYFNVGSGKYVKYSNESKFVSSYNVIRDFSRTSLDRGKRKKSKKCGSSYYFFCPDSNCTSVFETEDEFDAHVLRGIHTRAKETTVMDQVRSSFVKKMKVSSSEHFLHPTTKVITLNENLNEASARVPHVSDFRTQGWAIPKRSNFRYAPDQKKFLYDLFMDGETSGKKKSAEEVELLIRKRFSSDKYVTVQQIKSLFHRFTKELRNGTLQDPCINTEPENEDEEEEEDEHEAESASDKQLIIDFVEAVDDVMSAVSQWEPGDWTVVRYGRQWFPGIVMEANEVGMEPEEGFVVVNCMERKSYGLNQFKWPTNPDIEKYSARDLLCGINEVTPARATNGDSEIIWMALDTHDFEDANSFLKRALREG